MMKIGWVALLAGAVAFCGGGQIALAQGVSPSNSASSAQTETTEISDEGPASAPGFLEVIGTSMFGPQPDPERTWTPLTMSDFGEGWQDAWIAPPSPTGGSRRQGWVGSNDAFFNRMFAGIYSYANGQPGRQDEQAGAVQFETPITRRYMLGVFSPVVNSLQNGGAPSLTGVGDVVLENRFILQETQDQTLTFNLNTRLPTGVASVGGNRTSLTPFLALFRDIGRGFSIRGIAGVDAPVDSRPDGINSTFIGQLGIGQTLTPHDVPLFGDFTYYMMTNYREFFGPGSAYVSLTPGLRTHLGQNFWLLGGVEVPVTGPHSFQDRLTFVLVKGY